MSLVTLPYTFTVGNTIIASQHNSNFSTIYNDYNGNITDANIAANAQIAYTKLALNGTIKSTDLNSMTVLSASNLPVGTSVGNIVQLVSGTTPALPAVRGNNLTNISNPSITAILGAVTTLSFGSTYGPSATDGFLYGYIASTGSGISCNFYTDTNSNPSTQIGNIQYGSASPSGTGMPFMFPIPKGNYYKTSGNTGSGAIFFIALGS